MTRQNSAPPPHDSLPTTGRIDFAWAGVSGKDFVHRGRATFLSRRGRFSASPEAIPGAVCDIRNVITHTRVTCANVSGVTVLLWLPSQPQ